MKRTGKRMLSVLVALMMLLALLPTTALADENATYTEWTNSSSLPASGTYKLMTDVTVTDKTTVGGWASTRPETPTTTLVLDLNGHTITATNEEVFFIQVSGGLTIEDSVGTGKITNAGITGTSKTLIRVNSGAFALSGGTLENTTSSGYVLFVNGSAVATVTGGEVKNTVNGGYAVYVNGTAGAFEMSNGSVVQESTYASSAAIYANNNAKSVTISGGSITSQAMGIEAYFTPVTVTGGTIEAETYAFHTRKTTIPENSTVTVEAGTAVFYTLSNSENTVEAGSFDAPTLLKEYTAQGTSAAQAAVTVSGGTFTAPVSKEYCAENYASIIQADGSIIVDQITDDMIENDDGTYYADTAAAEANNEAKITNESGTTYYATLQAAIDAASEGATVTLTKDITVTETGTGQNDGAIEINKKNITLDGAGHTITAGTFSGEHHVINVTSDATIQNLTIVGNDSTKHGINVWAAADSTQPEVTVNNVTIQSCGTAAMVVNNSKVTATNLNTSGNAWGAVNVDNDGEFELKSGNLAENSQIWSEQDGNGNPKGTVTVPAGWQTVNMNKLDDKGNEDVKTHYTTDITKLGEAYNADTKTVYDTVERALSAAQSGETVQVIKDAELDASTDTTVPTGVTLQVNANVTLTTNDKLTNNGTINNFGTINGKVNNVNGTQKNTCTVTLNPNGGTLAGSTTYTQLEGTTIALPTPTRGGYYVFQGWSDGTTIYKGTYTATKDVTLTAQWVYIPPVNPNPTNSITTNPTANGALSVSPSNASKDTTVIINVTPDKDYELASLTVVDANGNRVPVKQISDTKFSFTMPDSKVTVNASFSKVVKTLPFTDVSVNDYFYDAVVWAVENGVTYGNTATTFGVGVTCNRADAVTFIWRAYGCPAPKNRENPFTDVSSNAYYADAVLWAVENGITVGTSATTFSPLESCRREHIVTFLYRAAGSPTVSHSSGFTDVADSAYYANAVTWAAENGITVGAGSTTTFGPTQNCFREQIVTFLYRNLAE